LRFIFAATVLFSCFGSLKVYGQLTIDILLQNPKQYDGQEVTVLIGYYVDEFENRSVWNTRKDAKNFNIKESIWLDSFSDNIKYLDKNGNELTNPISYKSKWLITGTLYCNPDTVDGWMNGYGHMNAWPAELRNVTIIKRAK